MTPDERAQAMADLKATLERTRIVGRCHDCKHWDERESRGAQRACAVIGTEFDDDVPVAFIALTRHGYQQAERHPGNVALFTVPTFGCALFERREPSGDVAEAAGET